MAETLPKIDNATLSGKTARKGIFYGWWVLLALFFCGMLGPMGRYALTAVAPFMQDELSITKSEIGLAFSIHLWIYSLFVPLVGWLMDRVGARKVMLAGGIILALTLAALSRINALWQLYFIFGLFMAMAVSMTYSVPCQTTTRRWFVKRAGLASGINSDAFAVGSAVLAPVLTGIAAGIGWRGAWLLCAPAFGITITLLAGLVVRDSPECMGLYPDGISPEPKADNAHAPQAAEKKWTTRAALGTSPFWLLFVAHSLSGFPAQGILSHIVLWGVNLGGSPATAGIFMTAIALPSIVTRVLGGWLGDKIGKRRIMVIGFMLILIIMIIAWLTVISPNSLLVVALIFGVVYGLPLASFPAYLGDLYGRASLGTLVGIQIFGSTFIGGFAPLIWGRIADVTGNYNLACLLSAIIYAIAIVALLLVKPEKLAVKVSA